jgi:hypothetical protein
MSLHSICTNALNELGGFEVPGSFYGNANATATKCVALVTREGNSLEKEFRWSVLITSTTVTTVSGTANYDLPTDFRAFANMSQWDRTNDRQLSGPLSGAVWQYRKSGVVASSDLNRGFRIQNNDIYIDPTPTSADTLAYDYYSKYWIIKQSDSSTTNTFSSDNDTCRLDEDLLTLALKWRFLQSGGYPFEAEYREYESMKTSLLDDDGGKPRICLGKTPYIYTNLPETGFGS